MAARRSFREDLVLVIHGHIAPFIGGIKLRINRFPWARRVALTLVSGISRVIRLSMPMAGCRRAESASPRDRSY